MMMRIAPFARFFAGICVGSVRSTVFTIGTIPLEARLSALLSSNLAPKWGEGAVNNNPASSRWNNDVQDLPTQNLKCVRV